MKSAYTVLGVPGNSTRAEIDDAFGKAEAHCAVQSLKGDQQAAARLADLRNAYNVLRDEESRASHDRMLSAGLRGAAPSRPSQYAGTAGAREPTRSQTLLLLSAAVIALIVVAGIYFSYKKQAARHEQALIELQARQLAADEAGREATRVAADEVYRARLVLINEQKDLQFRQESSRAIADARSAEAQRNYQDSQRLATEQREAQTKEYESRMREQTALREGQQRLAKDKARIRELCYQNYRRSDC